MNESIQLATFHPNYVFDDSSRNYDDVTNYTNRSPFPMIHFLRVDDVSFAIENFDGSTETIWRKNKRILRAIGKENILKKLKAITDGIDESSKI